YLFQAEDGILGELVTGVQTCALPIYMVVVGGGVIEAGELILEPARRAFLDSVEAPEHRPEVPLVAAMMGNDAGAVGAADLAWLEIGRASCRGRAGGAGAGSDGRAKRQ